MGSSFGGAEIAVGLIQNHIKANIAAALADVRTDRTDNTVSTEPPHTESYFIYPKAAGYKTPAIFTICEGYDLKKRESGANFVSAMGLINVAALIEDRDAEKLTKKSWRYQSALQKILDERQLSSLDGKVKIIITVTRHSFSPLYSDAKDEQSPQATFRKEILVECEVEHFENF